MKTGNKIVAIPDPQASLMSVQDPSVVNSNLLPGFATVTKPAKRTKRAKKEKGIADKSKEMLSNLITMGQLQAQSTGSTLAVLKPSSAMRIDLVKLGRGARIS